MTIHELIANYIDRMIWAHEIIERGDLMNTPLGDIGLALWINLEVLLLLMITAAICWAPFGALYGALTRKTQPK